MLSREMHDPWARYIGHDDFVKLPDRRFERVNTARQLLKAYRQLDPILLLPTYSAEARYMSKIIIQLKMQQEIATKIQFEEESISALNDMLEFTKEEYLQ